MLGYYLPTQEKLKEALKLASGCDTEDLVNRWKRGRGIVTVNGSSSANDAVRLLRRSAYSLDFGVTAMQKSENLVELAGRCECACMWGLHDSRGVVRGLVDQKEGVFMVSVEAESLQPKLELSGFDVPNATDIKHPRNVARTLPGI